MKNIRFLTFVLTIGTLLLSACGAADTAATPAPLATSGGTKVDAMPVAFVGIVDSMAGNQWVISGTTVTVDASIVRDGPFNVGDQVKVEGFVNPDGSFTISRVEAPTPQEAATLTPPSVDNSNEAPINANTNDSNVNDDGNVNTNDDNSNSSNSNDSNTNDDNGGGNTNDDNSNDGNTNDDNGGGNTNDDNSNDSNSKDDGGGNSSDDNGNDDNSGGGGGNDDSGGDDNGSGGNGNDD
jgi:hypothetical protein